MIIVDLQQIMVASLMVQIGRMKKDEISEDLLRHMILNSVRAYNIKHTDKYGEMILACDARRSWRKDYFPYYKANRKTSRDESPFDWEAIFKYFGNIKEEIKKYMPYRVIQVDGAEGDDVIATLVHKFGPEGARILILSGDKDFIQLHKYMGVEQFDPVRKKKIFHALPDRFRQEHIIKGDKGDGVPSILMADNSLVLRERAKPISQKKLDAWVGKRPEEFCNELMLQRWHRNREVIDLDFIPKDLQTQILLEYESEAGKNRKQILNYFIKYKLKNLTESINDF